MKRIFELIKVVVLLLASFSLSYSGLVDTTLNIPKFELKTNTINILLEPGVKVFNDLYGFSLTSGVLFGDSLFNSSFNNNSKIGLVFELSVVKNNTMALNNYDLGILYTYDYEIYPFYISPSVFLSLGLVKIYYQNTENLLYGLTIQPKLGLSYRMTENLNLGLYGGYNFFLSEIQAVNYFGNIGLNYRFDLIESK